MKITRCIVILQVPYAQNTSVEESATLANTRKV
jgi:hypothetical protein